MQLLTNKTPTPVVVCTGFIKGRLTSCPLQLLCIPHTYRYAATTANDMQRTSSIAMTLPVKCCPWSGDRSDSVAIE